ncbi:MAG: electron transfer flavoprotein subunit alpha/FixB family protein [Chloroflexi bacterium]|nr:electron transfer flavoprotein subunit alpha/FixB family protein [Chloroflexota bacterium]
MPSPILVVAEEREGKLNKVSFELLGAARRLAEGSSGGVMAALLGSGLEALAPALGHYGASRVYLVDSPALAQYSPEAYAQALVGLVQKIKPEVIFLSATSRGRDLAPRLGAKLGVVVASDCTDFTLQDSGRLLITRPIFAGKALAQVRLKGTPQIATLRPNIFPPLSPETSRTAAIEKITVEGATARAVTKEVKKAAAGKKDVAEAEIIVSGGRGMKGPENYHLLEELAEALGGAVGASRAAVDAGWRPHSDQVGQTGKTVTPKLYVACGISGAIQHLAGMKTAKYIVAINKDPEAPIFKIADYGIVGDLFEIVPLITAEAKKLKSYQ